MERKGDREKRRWREKEMERTGDGQEGDREKRRSREKKMEIKGDGEKRR